MSARCLDCGNDLPQRKPGPGRPRDYCNSRCSKRYRRRHGGRPPRAVESLGPAVPLNGVTPEAAQRQKELRAVALVAQGLRPHDVAERLGMVPKDVSRLARSAGVALPARRDWLPEGLPV